jgi:flagellar motor protein MotB
MNDTEPVPPSSEAVNPALPVYLGLFLLVLAFFIVLVSMSTIEKVRSNAVMNSLTSAFSSILPPTNTPAPFLSLEGDILAAPQFQAQIGELFSTAIQVAKVEVVQPGRLMRVAMPAESLFVEGQAQVKPEHYPLLDRVVATLSGRPPGLRFDMEFVLGVRAGAGRALPVEQTLEMARAGAFAREMARRGAPPDSVAIGLSAGDPGDAVMWFYVRGEEETRLRFLEDEGAPAPAR